MPEGEDDTKDTIGDGHEMVVDRCREIDTKALVALAGGGDEAKVPADGPHQGPGGGQHKGATVKKLKYVDTGHEYKESRQKFKNSKVMENTGQQIQMYENTKTDSEMFNEAAFLGWCTDYRGTNAASDVPTSSTQLDQNVMGYERPHQQGSHHGHLGADRAHPQRVGYWVRQQADHTHHRGDPLWDTGGQQEVPEGHDHQDEPPGRAQERRAVVEGCALHDDRVRQHVGHAHNRGEPPGRAHGQEEVVKGCAHHDDLPWDTGGQRGVAEECAHHGDPPWDTTGGGEPPHEVWGEVDDANGVDVIVEQVPTPTDQGEHREQENDAQVPVLMGGGGVAKSRLSNQLQHELSRWYRTGSNLLPCELSAAHSNPRHRAVKQPFSQSLP